MDRELEEKFKELSVFGLFSTSMLAAFIAVNIYSVNYQISNLENSLKEHKIQSKDLNNNGIPEVFYEIEGKKYFLSIDGKSIEDTFR